ncbi:hypothetical protein N0V95_003124 [Ascochyta clinopodiicola]|nr:hypothetical protein N0V95_003124 [Ascochyta clinopodiicola]
MAPPIYGFAIEMFNESTTKKLKFFVRGVVYQVPDIQDPISDARLPQLRHDVALFKELGLNTLFVYRVDNTKRHGQAMRMLEEAGIYVFTGVPTRFNAISRLDPYQSYNRTTIEEYCQTVDVMAQYPNVLGLLVATSLFNNRESEKAVPVFKAVARDLKRYMKLQNESCGQRILPIGYDAATTDNRDRIILDYLSSGDPASSIDFWTVSFTPLRNVIQSDSSQCTCYLWSGRSSLQISGYQGLIDHLQNAAIPIVMSEYGLRMEGPRLFQETAALYSPQMSQVFSGGCAYEFHQSANLYGLVELIDQEQARTTPAWAVQKSREKALARSDDPEKTAEKRKTERGTLSIFHDFLNYKENLDATRGIETHWEGDIMEREAAERANVDTSHKNWPWELQIPNTVVDWARLESEVNGL